MKKLISFTLLSALVFGLFLALGLLFSCTKAYPETGQIWGNKAALIGEKYSANWSKLKVDTLWQDKNIAPQEFKKILAAKQIDTIGKADCPPLCYVFLNGENVAVQYEILKYIY